MGRARALMGTGLALAASVLVFCTFPRPDRGVLPIRSSMVKLTLQSRMTAPHLMQGGRITACREKVASCHALRLARATPAIREDSLRLGAPTLEVIKHDLAGSEDEESLGIVFEAVERACVEISRSLARVSIDRLTGDEGNINVQGEKQKKLDVVANELMKKALFETGLVAAIATEEEPDVIWAPDEISGPAFAVAFDPLDGSSNIDCSIPTGTIFSVYKLQDASKARSSKLNPFLADPSSAIIGSGYAMYSSATSLVVSVGQGTHILSLDPDRSKFVLTSARVQVPPRGPYYSLNEGRFFDWPDGLKNYINDVKQGNGKWGKKYSSRYVCSLVADVHRTILYGGWAGNPRPHLRLLFEAAPLSFLVEQAGGKGSDGVGRILSTAPHELHQRLPVFIGSSEDIDELESYGNVQQGAAKYEA